MATVPQGLPTPLAADLKQLREQLHEHRNAVFPIVGSGLSGVALPSWSKMLEALIEQAPADVQPELRDLMSKGRYLEVASLLEDSREGLARVLSFIKQNYQRPRATPPPTYDQVAALSVDHFATTNYNPWLKDAVTRRLGATPRVYVPGDPEAFSDIGPTSGPLVLMLHGDADRPGTCVLSQRSYRRVQYQASFRQAMLALASHRTFLFVGHSLSDPDLVSVLEEWAEVIGGESQAPRHVCLGAGFSRATRLRLIELGVRPIQYGEGNDHSLLPNVLDYLAAPPASALAITARSSDTTIAAPTGPTSMTAAGQPAPPAAEHARVVGLLAKLLDAEGQTVTAPGQLTHHDTGSKRAVDVVVESVVHGQSIFLSYEVADAAGAADVGWVESMLKKHERLPTSHLYLVSWTGFSDEATAVARATPRCSLVALASDSAGAPTVLYADEVTLTLERVEVRLRLPDGDSLTVRADRPVVLFDAAGEARGPLWALCTAFLNSRTTGEAVLKSAHHHPQRDEMTWFTLHVPAIAMPLRPACLRKDQTGELHPIEELILVGTFSFRQTRVELAALEFRGRAMAHGTVDLGGQTRAIAATRDEAGGAKVVEIAPAIGIASRAKVGTAPAPLGARAPGERGAAATGYTQPDPELVPTGPQDADVVAPINEEPGPPRSAS